MTKFPELMKRGVRTALRTVLGAEPTYVSSHVIFGPARGIKLSLRVSPDGEFEFLLGRYEREVAEKLAEFCTPGSVVWECGAHIGYFTSLLARLVGPQGRVVVFEPDPSNRSRTQTNLKLNGFTNTEVVPVAIGEDKKGLPFVSNRGATSRLESTYVGAEAFENIAGNLLVDSMALDTVLKSGRYPAPQILKMDIEGAELLAIPGAQTLLSTCRPIVFIESHNPQTDLLIWETFERLNYSLLNIPKGEKVEDVGQVERQLLAVPRK